MLHIKIDTNHLLIYYLFFSDPSSSHSLRVFPSYAHMTIADAEVGYREIEIREQDRFLPVANIARIMKKILPPNAKIAKEAKESIQTCVSEFISFVTSEASGKFSTDITLCVRIFFFSTDSLLSITFIYFEDKCVAEKRKTVNGEDLLYGLNMLGFSSYEGPLKIYLDKYRDTVKGEKPEKEGKKYIKKEKKEKPPKIYKQRSSDSTNKINNGSQHVQQAPQHYHKDNTIHTLGTTYVQQHQIAHTGPILAPLPLIDEYGKPSSILMPPQVKVAWSSPSSSSLTRNSVLAYDALISRSQSNSNAPYSLESQLSKLYNSMNGSLPQTPLTPLKSQHHQQSTDMVRATSIDSYASSVTTTESNTSSLLETLQSEYVADMMVDIIRANSERSKNDVDNSHIITHDKTGNIKKENDSFSDLNRTLNGSLGNNCSNDNENLHDDESGGNISGGESPLSYSFIGYDTFEQTIINANKRPKLEVV